MRHFILQVTLNIYFPQKKHQFLSPPHFLFTCVTALKSVSLCSFLCLSFLFETAGHRGQDGMLCSYTVLAPLFTGCMNLGKSLDLFGFSFLICKMGLIMAPTHRDIVRIKQDNPHKALKKVTGTQQVLNKSER